MNKLAVTTSLCVSTALWALAAPPVTDGLKFWVDASDATSVTTNANGLVSQWNDLSGTGNHVAQAAESAKPVYNPTGLNGKPSLSFNSTNVLYRSGSLLCYSNHTAFLVAEATAFNENDMLGSGGTSAGDILVMHYTTSGNKVFRGHYWAASSMVSKDSAVNTTVSNAMVYVHRMGAEGLEILRNSSRDAFQPFSGTLSGNKKGIVLGYRSSGGSPGKCFAGELSEVLIYERALGAAEREQVEAYLTAKWLDAYAAVEAPPVTDGLKFRCDASVLQSVLTDAEGRVIQCRDLSGNGIHLQQKMAGLTATNQPVYKTAVLNGKPALVFDRTNVLSTTANTINASNHTVFVVAKAMDVSSNMQWGNDLVGTKSAGADAFLLNLRNGFLTGTYWITNDPPVTLTSATPHTFATTLYEQRLDDAGLEVFKNGVSDGSMLFEGRTNVLVGVSLGYRTEAVYNDYGFIGAIAEVLIYDRALSVGERQQTETYLTNKWFSASANDLPVTRNLKFRVDASDASTVVTTAQGRVSWWSGKGPTEYFARQALPEKQPSYNPHGIRWRPSLSFNGTNVMAFPLNAINYSNHTVFVVAQAASGNSAKDILGSGGTAPGDILLMNYQNKFRGHYFPGTNIAAWISLDSLSPTVLTPVIYTQLFSDTALRIYRNGILDNTKTAGLSYTNVLRAVTLGSRQASGSDYFVGEMSEVLIYDCALTDEERQQVEVYLYAKWLRDRRGTLIRML